MGGSIAVSAAEVANEFRPGLRVRPPPSLLRGLQAPPGSLSPLGGAALRARRISLVIAPVGFAGSVAIVGFVVIDAT